MPAQFLRNNLSFGFISLILRDFSLSSRFFYLEKGILALPFDKNPKNLRELSYENKQNKLKIQVNKIFNVKDFAKHISCDTP
jgi:hypothetical protein